MIAIGNVNYVAVVVAAVVTMIIGMLWHGPLFGKTWMKLAGIKAGNMNDKKMKAAMMSSMVWAFVGSLLTAFVMAHFVVGVALGDALMWTGLIWIGFVMVAQVSPVLWEGKSKNLFYFSTIYSLVSLLIVAAVLNLMG